MAGGTFDKTVGKYRPGTYVNFEDDNVSLVNGSARGRVLIPLVNTDYGPPGVFIEISAAAMDASKPLLGWSILDDDTAGNMLLIREAFKGANTVIVYICTDGTAKASGTGGGLNASAKYKGTRGNKLSYSVVANPAGGFDVTIFLDGSAVEVFEKATVAADLAGSAWIDFTAHQTTPGTDDAMAAVAGVTLSGGTSTTTANADVSNFLDAIESVSFNTLAFPLTESTLHTACKTKIKYLRENVGRGVQAVCPSFVADYEGIINVTNSYGLEGVDLTAAQATAFVAGITAGASNVQSNTYRIVDSAIKVVNPKGQSAAETALKNSEFFFSASESGDVIVECDVNSIKTFTAKKGEHYHKNRVLRVFDTFEEALMNNFPPNKYDNDPDGWEIMKGVGKSIMKLFGPRSTGGVGAIKNIDYDNDFQIDEELSEGDKTFFDVWLQPVDSAEKLFFTCHTR